MSIMCKVYVEYICISIKYHHVFCLPNLIILTFISLFIHFPYSVLAAAAAAAAIITSC